MLLIRRNVEREAEGHAAEKLKAEGFKEVEISASLKELKAAAKERGIEGYSRMTIEQMQEALKDVIR